MKDGDTFQPEFIVLGGGTAGILTCHQLLLKGFRVLLLERGEISFREKENSFGEEFWSDLCNDSVHSEAILTEPQLHLFNRSVRYPQGVGLGGTSCINAMLHDIGDLRIFDNYWPRSTWNSEIIREYHRNLDTFIKSQPIRTTGMISEILGLYSENELPKLPRCLFSVQSSSRWKLSSLLNTLFQCDETCAARFRVIRGNVKRMHFAEQSKEVKHTSSRSMAMKRAVLIEIEEALTTLPVFIDVNGTCEVILCCGVFGSPRVLVNSGVHTVHGSSREHETQADLQVVDIGDNLQDHSLLGTVYWGNWRKNYNSATVDLRKRSFEKFDVLLPLNCVHGCLYLDHEGNIIKKLDEANSEIPR
jgi:choline dehydrogenase